VQFKESLGRFLLFYPEDGILSALHGVTIHKAIPSIEKEEL
jgi:hypothetical protein